MMNKWLLMLMLFTLAACGIRVDDLGSYWNRGTMDPRLEGSWLIQDVKSPGTVFFTKTGGMYRVDSVEKKTEKKETNWIKSLHAGPYDFAIQGPHSAYTLHGAEGGLVRYVIVKDRLQACFLKPEPMQRFIAENYPRNSNISMNDCKHADKAGFCWEELHITRLDDDILKILAHIPNNDDYWECSEVMRKVRQ